ncbi:MAG: hypothetical protein QOD92_2119 [Acidimicrobiaceae bacterium]
MRRTAVLLLVVLLVACSSGGGPKSRASTSPGPKLLFFATPLGVTVVDADSLRATVTVPDGILAPNRATVFGTTADAARTVLHGFEPQSGQARALASLDGFQRLRVANHDGSAVVLGPPRTTAGTDYPSGRSITQLTIVRTDGGPSRSLDVMGNVEPEAFSNDDTNLFVLQYLPADAPVGYQVRRLDLSTGELHNIRTDDSDLDKPMAGRARTQVLSPDGTKLYTLYVVAGEVPGDAGYAFVHVLDLVGKQAFCIDLPSPFGTDGDGSYAVAITRDGAGVYVIDAQHGAIATLDTNAMSVSPTVLIPAMPSAATFAAVDPAGKLLLGAGPELWSLEPHTLSIETRYSLDASIAAIVTTSFDANVYVAVNDTIYVFDSKHIGAGPISNTRVAGAPGLVAADPVPPVGNRGPIECAC